MILTQQEADDLIQLSKDLGMDYVRELLSLDRREKFFLDIRRSRRQRAYLRYQTRARQCIVLARLEIDGLPATRIRPTGMTKADVGLQAHISTSIGKALRIRLPMSYTRFLGSRSRSLWS